MKSSQLNLRFINKQTHNIMLWLFLTVGVTTSNISIADEVCEENCVVRVGTRIKPGEIGVGGGLGRDGGGYGGGSFGGSGGGSSTKEECEAKIDSATATSIAQCQDAVVVGGAAMGGTFCLSIATITSFFATPLVGGFAGVACATAGAVGGNEAHKACRDAGNAAGDKQKVKCK